MILKHEIGKYWVEFSYDYNGVENVSEIQDLINYDRNKWLKDLSREISKVESSGSNVDDLLNKELSLDELAGTSIVSESENNVSGIIGGANVETEEASAENNTSSETIVEETNTITEEQNTSESVSPITGNVISKTGEAISNFVKRIRNLIN